MRYCVNIHSQSIKSSKALKEKKEITNIYISNPLKLASPHLYTDHKILTNSHISFTKPNFVHISQKTN